MHIYNIKGINGITFNIINNSLKNQLELSLRILHIHVQHVMFEIESIFYLFYNSLPVKLV
jgi:hypothetical protein